MPVIEAELRAALTAASLYWYNAFASSAIMFSLLSMASKPVIAASAEMISVFNAGQKNVYGQATGLMGGSAVWLYATFSRILFWE